MAQPCRRLEAEKPELACQPTNRKTKYDAEDRVHRNGYEHEAKDDVNFEHGGIVTDDKPLGRLKVLRTAN